MSCYSGNFAQCLDQSLIKKATLDNYLDRNVQCQSVCGSTMNHGYAEIKPICKCCPNRNLMPCDKEDLYEKLSCYLDKGYMYFTDECVTSPEPENQFCNGDDTSGFSPFSPSSGSGSIAMNNNLIEGYSQFPALRNNKKGFAPKYREYKNSSVDRSVGAELNGIKLGGLHSNAGEYISCDYTFPYDNDINLQYDTTWKGEDNDQFSKLDGGYLKYDKMTDEIALIAMNPRQGGDKIADLGILRTPSIDPLFEAESLTNDDLKVYIEDVTDDQIYSKEDSLLESKLDNKGITVEKDDMRLVFDFFTCQYGTLRIKDRDFQKGIHQYFVFGLGPITTTTTDDFSLNWTEYKRRCNQGLGNMQAFSIYGSHFPVMYVMRYNKMTNEQKCYLCHFDHFRKTEYFFDDLQTKGIIKIRSREPEFRFYVSIEDTILDLREQFMKVTGAPQPPIQKAMGLWMQKFGYENWEDLEKDIKSIRDNNFPCDGYIFDLYWYGHFFPKDLQLSENSYDMNFCHQKKTMKFANEMGKFKWDEKNFPNHKEYLNNLMEKYNYGSTIIQEPYFTADSEDFSFMYYNDMVAKLENGTWAQPEGVWISWIGNHAAMPDFTNPETSKHWFETRIVPNITNGTFFWWNDLSEPEIYNENALYLGIGQVNDNGEMMHEFKQTPDVLNYNQLLWVEGLSKEYKEKLNRRYNVLCRAGTIGIQRHGAYLWPGDSRPKLTELNASTNSLATLNLSGIDFSATDAGGFYHISEGDEDERQKLYSMWFANSAATNFTLKPHKYVDIQTNQTTASPAYWGNKQDNLFNTIERYMLSPYYYSCAMDISSFGDNQGNPFTTTMFFKYQYLQDPLLFQSALIDRTNSLNEFVGPNLMYCMLYKYGETSRDIYFPNNTVFFDHRNNVWVFGGKKYTVKFTSKNICPLFIRNNSIVVKRSPPDNILEMRYDDNIKSYDIFIYSFDGLEADPFTLYIDDGVSMNRDQIKLKIKFKNGYPYIKLLSDVVNFDLPNFNYYLVSKGGIQNIEMKENFEPDSDSESPDFEDEDEDEDEDVESVESSPDLESANLEDSLALEEIDDEQENFEPMLQDDTPKPVATNASATTKVMTYLMIITSFIALAFLSTVLFPKVKKMKQWKVKTILVGIILGTVVSLLISTKACM
jgi:alpha-glucosidase (family GH31 glycosyl hydrolase)